MLDVVIAGRATARPGESAFSGASVGVAVFVRVGSQSGIAFSVLIVGRRSLAAQASVCNSHSRRQNHFGPVGLENTLSREKSLDFNVGRSLIVAAGSVGPAGQLPHRKAYRYASANFNVRSY